MNTRVYDTIDKIKRKSHKSIRHEKNRRYCLHFFRIFHQTTCNSASPRISGADLEHREQALSEPCKILGVFFAKETDGHTRVDASDKSLSTCSTLRALVYAMSALAAIWQTLSHLVYQQDHGIKNRHDGGKQGFHDWLEGFRLFQQPQSSKDAYSSDCIDSWYLSANCRQNANGHDETVEDAPGVLKKKEESVCRETDKELHCEETCTTRTKVNPKAQDLLHTRGFHEKPENMRGKRHGKIKGAVASDYCQGIQEESVSAQNL